MFVSIKIDNQGIEKMRILHTADWHLGRSLYGRKRYVEFEAFLNWLASTIEAEKIDVLLIAGDVFDTCTPSNKAQNLYYSFLYRISKTCCRHVVIIGGNHDSPSFLNAPKELLSRQNVHVVGSMTESLEDEVYVLCENGQPEAIVCAVPYLRDKDLRTIEPGETIDGKNTKLIQGLKKHYAEVCAIAEQKRDGFKEVGCELVPIIAMGHLFTAGGKTVDGDGVRDLYVGTLAHVGESVFPPSIDYLALGHLHVPQVVSGEGHIRYSGSPIPMGYGEATQEKVVVVVEFNGTNPVIQEVAVPCFQKLIRIVGALEDIYARLKELKSEESSAWIEIEYTDRDFSGNIRELILEAIKGSNLEILRIKDRHVLERVISQKTEKETLEDLKVEDVFNRYLDDHDIPEDKREALIFSHDEIVKSLHEEDKNAE